MLRALIVDDHPVVRAGIREILQETGEFRTVEEAASGQQALGRIREGAFDMVVLDISLPDINGLEVLREIRRRSPDMKVLVLSRHPEEQYAVGALKLGAMGYVSKNKVPEELAKAIRKVASGRKYVTPEIAEKILDAALHPEGENPPHTLLSEREMQVFLRLALGKTVSRCAQELFLSVNTISTYRQRVLEKLRLKTNAQLIRYAAEHGFID